MAYIGPEPNPGQNREVDDISSGFNGSTTAFTLQVSSQNVSPGSANAIIVSLGGVVQNPGTDYTVAASTLTFTTAPASGLSFFGLVLGQQIDTQSLADGTSPTMSAPTITGDLSIADKIVHTGDTNNAIRFPAADTIAAETAGSERARIDSSGRVLAGTSSARTNFKNGATGNGQTPTFQFETANTDEANSLSLTFGRNNVNGAEILLAKHRAATVGGTTVVQSGDRLGGLTFAGSDGTNFQPAALIQSLVDGTPGTNDMPGNLTFSTTADGAIVPTERMRLHSNGAISVGTNDSARSFTLYNPVSSDTIFRIQNNNNNEDTGLEVLYVADSTTRTMRMGGYIQANNQNFQIANTEGFTFYTNTGTGTHERLILAKNGDVNAQGVYDSTTSNGANVNVHSDGHLRRSTSSKRYKNTITDATHGLTELLKLKSVTFKGNDDGDTVFGGLIAEDVHDAGLTEFVQYDKDNQPDALAYGNMVALCVKSIQELSAKVTTLETEVAALKAA